MTLRGAFRSIKSSTFSEMSKTIAIATIRAIENRKVPRNFRMMYESKILIFKLKNFSAKLN